MKIQEFFQDDDYNGSMGRVGIFVTLCVASVIMLWLTYKNGMNHEYFSTYIDTFTVSFLGSKALDKRTFGNKAPNGTAGNAS